MADAFIGEIRLLPYYYAPDAWLTCNGQTVSIQQYQTLFAVIGNLYGGSMQQGNFAVPNLQGRVAAGAGNNPAVGFSPTVGATGGNPTVTLSVPTMPAHSHALNGAQLAPPQRSAAPGGNLLTGITFQGSPSNVGSFPYTVPPAGTAAVPLSPATLSAAGSSTPHENRQPVLGLQWCICAADGAFPIRP